MAELPDLIGGLWGAPPAAAVGALGDTGISAGRWRLDRPPAFSGARFDRHVVTLVLRPIRRHVLDVDGRRAWDGAVPAGAVQVVRAGEVPHAEADVGPVEFVHLYVPPAALERVAREAGMARSEPAGGGFAPAHPSLRASVRSLLALAAGPAPGDRLYGDLLGRLIALQLLRHHAGGTPPARRDRGGLGPRALGRVQALIAEHLGEEFTLARLAAEAGASPWHFARAFRCSTGASPFVYLRRQRVERAKALLAASDLPLAEVAFRCGFKGQSHFGQVFRERVGATPADYRRRVRA